MANEAIANIFVERPEVIDIDLEAGKLSWKNTLGYTTADLNLSKYQKDLIQNGGSVGVMVKLAAELQTAGKI